MGSVGRFGPALVIPDGRGVVDGSSTMPIARVDSRAEGGIGVKFLARCHEELSQICAFCVGQWAFWG